MRKKLSNCNLKSFSTGLGLFFSDFVSGYKIAWRRINSDVKKRGEEYTFMESLVVITMIVIIAFSIFLIFWGGGQIVYWLGMISLYAEGSIAVSSAPLLWGEKANHQFEIMMAGLFEITRLMFILAIAYGICKFFSRICKRGQPGASKMFADEV